MKIDDKYDVLIVGGGAAGLSAAIWCSDLGLRAALFEREAEFGGQMLRIFNRISNYPGVITSNGREMRERFAAQAADSSAILNISSEVIAIDCRSKTISMSDGNAISGRYIIIATGVRRRRLGVPGELEFAGAGILDSGARSPQAVAGKRVAIVGGGDAAMENALILSKHARRIYVIHRGKQFSARPEFVNAAKETTNVEFLTPFSVRAILGKKKVEAVEVEHLDKRERRVVKVENVLIRVGVEPNTDFFGGALDLDERGFIRIDNSCETNVSGVFAIGDVANRTGPSISGAVGQAAITAKAIAAKNYA